MSFYSSIDWSQPWYAAILPAAQQVVAASSWRVAINQRAQELGLRNALDQAIQFVPQEQLPEGVAYEAYIGAEGKVPTRENLHDFFNALVWLSFPKIKQQLNALQAAQIARLGIGKSRGPARDAATIFDENAALLVVEESEQGRALVSALRNHQWQQAFIEQRQMFGAQAEVWSFGHALMEKLVRPYKAITAHAWVVWVEPTFFASDAEERRQHIDQQVAQQLANHPLATTDYTPLPVLGIPNWWQEQDVAFYGDAHVFRPPRSLRSA